MVPHTLVIGVYYVPVCEDNMVVFLCVADVGWV